MRLALPISNNLVYLGLILIIILTVYFHWRYRQKTKSEDKTERKIIWIYYWPIVFVVVPTTIILLMTLGVINFDDDKSLRLAKEELKSMEYYSEYHKFLPQNWEERWRFNEDVEEINRARNYFENEWNLAKKLESAVLSTPKESLSHMVLSLEDLNNGVIRIHPADSIEPYAYNTRTFENYGDFNKTHSIKVDRDSILIPNPIELESDKKIVVYFETTKDDQTSNQYVKPILKESIEHILENANKRLQEYNVSSIESITISSTTNGTHAKNSYHRYGLAVDIAGINGARVRDYRLSLNWNSLMKSNPVLIKNTLKKYGTHETEIDDVRDLAIRVARLQDAVEEYKFRIENLGPFIQKKNGENYPVNNHNDHLHFSFFKN